MLEQNSYTGRVPHRAAVTGTTKAILNVPTPIELFKLHQTGLVSKLRTTHVLQASHTWQQLLHFKLQMMCL